MTTEAEQEARLMRIVRHYTGGDDVNAFMETTAYKSAYSKSEGDSELAIASLALITERGVTLQGWFIRDASGISKKDKEPWAASVVLLPDGSTRLVGDGQLGLKFLEPVTVSGVEKKFNVATNVTTFRAGKESEVSPGGHSESPPNVTLTAHLAEARSMRRRGQTELRVNSLNDVFFVAQNFEDDGHGIFVNQPNEKGYGGGVSFYIRDTEGNVAQVSMSAHQFEQKFGLDPFADMDETKDQIRGRTVRIYGGIDVTAKLTDELEADLRPELVKVLQEKCRTSEAGKTELRERAIVGGKYTIERVYNGPDGAVFLVDCAQLNYAPRVTTEVKSGVKNDKEWVIGQGNDIQFVGLTEGKRTAPAAFKGMADLLQKRLNITNEPPSQPPAQ